MGERGRRVDEEDNLRFIFIKYNEDITNYMLLCQSLDCCVANLSPGDTRSSAAVPTSTL